MFHVYILWSNSIKKYYIGYTNNLKDRIKLHNKGHGAKYLQIRLPVELVYSKEYKYYKNALTAERRLKKLTRLQKEQLIKIYESNPSHEGKL